MSEDNLSEANRQALAVARAEHDRRARFVLHLHAARPAAEVYEARQREDQIRQAWADMRLRLNPLEWIE
jgi:hypothetical protein